MLSYKAFSAALGRAWITVAAFVKQLKVKDKKSKSRDSFQMSFEDITSQMQLFPLILDDRILKLGGSKRYFCTCVGVYI